MKLRDKPLKPRTRLYAVGQTTYRLIAWDRGWGGPYGQDRRHAKWACVHCGAKVYGDDDWPVGAFTRRGFGQAAHWEPITPCARNGHAPCRACGQMLPRLNDGCPREHRWQICPGKTEADRVQPQHARAGHLARAKGAAC